MNETDTSSTRIWRAAIAATTIALWLYVEGADVGMVGVIRASRELEALLKELREALNQQQ